MIKCWQVLKIVIATRVYWGLEIWILQSGQTISRDMTHQKKKRYYCSRLLTSCNTNCRLTWDPSWNMTNMRNQGTMGMIVNQGSTTEEGRNWPIGRSVLSDGTKDGLSFFTATGDSNHEEGGYIHQNWLVCRGCKCYMVSGSLGCSIGDQSKLGAREYWSPFIRTH